jgi:hypothetical protein
MSRRLIYSPYGCTTECFTVYYKDKFRVCTKMLKFKRGHGFHLILQDVRDYFGHKIIVPVTAVGTTFFFKRSQFQNANNLISYTYVRS